MLPLILKAGIHYGPCIAVTLNERLDYFGSTVNMAARLENLSSGQDIIISHMVRADPEVSEFFARENGLKIEPVVGEKLKGFDEELIELWRVSSSVS
jgi:class 3 adenylate cyclase